MKMQQETVMSEKVSVK